MDEIIRKMFPELAKETREGRIVQGGCWNELWGKYDT